MVSSWIYLNVGIMVALVVLGAVAIGTLIGNKSEWILTDKPPIAEQDLESLEDSEDAEVRVQGYEECIKSLPDKKFVAEGVTKTGPFVVQLGWHAYQLKRGDISDIEVRILDKSGKPLSDVTYDFMYKGAIESGHIQDRYVEDFSVIEVDRFPLKIRHPCGMHFGVFIDKVGQQSFLNRIRSGNVSPVSLMFREMSDMTGNAEMIVFSDANTDPESTGVRVLEPPSPLKKVKVYMFPRNLAISQDAGEIAAKLRESVGLKFAMDYGVNTGASKQGIYDLEGEIIVPNGAEFYIDPLLKKPDGNPLTANDLLDNQLFGNGLTVGGIGIRSESQNQGTDIPAVFFVVGEPDISVVDENIDVVRDIIFSVES